MAEEIEGEKAPPEKKALGGGSWFSKIPKEILFSPGGAILISLAGILEIVDFFLPPSLVDSLIIEVIPEIFFYLMLMVFTRRSSPQISLGDIIAPFLIERTPGISDVLPTLLIKMFI